MSAGTKKRGKVDGGNGAGEGRSNDIDALFQLPLDEFTAARKALASRLKKSGREEKAAEVTALAKPSISAWVANQLYWKHREEFENLMTAGRLLMQAQVSQLAGKAAEMDKAQTEQREALSTLLHLSDGLLRNTGHSPTPDLVRRIKSTLETLSSYSSVAETPAPGRLTADVNPPGFESLASLIPDTGIAKAAAGAKGVVVPFKPRPKKEAPKKKLDETNASAKAALQNAEQTLREVQKAAQDLADAQKKAAAHLNETEKKRLEAEERYKNAMRAEEEARKQLDNLNADAGKTAKAVERAEQALEEAKERVR